MTLPCDCCAGNEAKTSEPAPNRPGLHEIAYRAGTYASFLDAMLARLSSHYVDVPKSPGSETLERIQPLRGLTTRAPSDAAIAVLDAWAVVADVLTFYQERIANEGYLLTASERRSVLELARLVGYRLRPGVSASVFLAFTAALGFRGVIPAGTRAQSAPAPGQSAQFFETSNDLSARDVWNALEPRLTRPQVITQAADFATDAATRETLYFQGVSTNLKAGDALLISLGGAPWQQTLRFVESVDAQFDEQRTEVTLRTTLPESDEDPVSDVLGPFVEMASSVFGDSELAGQVASILSQLIADVDAEPDTQLTAVRAVLPAIEQLHETAVRRNFSRLEPWLAEILLALRQLSSGRQFVPATSVERSGLETSALGSLAAIVEQLALPASLQPANPQRLARSVARAFSTQTDLAPRLLATFQPKAAPALYKAWRGVETPTSQAKVYALRVKAAPFGSTSPKQVPVVKSGLGVPSEWPISSDDQGGNLSLDASYEKIVVGSWVVLTTPDVSEPNYQQVLAVDTISRADYGAAGRVTRLTFGNTWLNAPSKTKPEQMALLRNFTVWAQPELLELAEEPLDTDVEGDTLELAELYDGLEAGRWLMVSGERTDIPNTTGVLASELVMIAGVSQGARSPLCVAFPADFLPFSKVYYVTDADVTGDRLVVGELSAGVTSDLEAIALPSWPGQQFCEQVQLADGFYANAYVPSELERNGYFPSFVDLLVDPTTGLRWNPKQQDSSLFAWRISAQAVHTLLTLANKLAYSYDAATVTINANVVKATHGQTVGEVLGDGVAAQVFQKFALHQQPLTFTAATTPAGAESTLLVRVNELEWHEQRSLAELGATDRGYVTETDDSGQTTIVFGDGEHGARLPSGTANVKALYRYGMGAAGNVAAGRINQLATQPPGAQSVVNPLAASGGADADELEQARENTPLAVMALDRLVSVRDYADFSRNFAGIGKASSVRLSDGRRQLVHVTIAGANDIPIEQSSDLYLNLVQSLYQFGDPFEPIQVALRKLKVIVIAARVRVLADYAWESVEAAVRAALLESFSFARRALGQPAFLAEVISVVQAVAGVSYVDVLTFDAIGEDVTAKQLAGLARTLTLKNAVSASLASVDATATDPAKRILPAELAILTPDLPDTLILTEITG
jgi:hypothetical protein